MPHRQLNDTFKLNPWSGVKGAASSIFKVDYEGAEILPIIDYMFKELTDAQFPLVRSGLLTLVNVYNPDTNHSVGYQDPPHEDLVKPMTGLVLTFQMMHRPFRKTPTKVAVNRFTDFTMLWGKSLREVTTCLTISIPKSITKNLRLNINHTDDLLYVYNVLGIASKNYVERPTIMNTLASMYDEPKEDVDSLYSKYFQQTLATTFKNSPFDLWPYTKAIWQEAPNLIGTRHVNDTFNLYFVLHLLDYVDVDEPNTIAYTYLNDWQRNTLKDFLHEGVRQFNMHIKSKEIPSTITPALYAVMNLIYGCYELNSFGEANRNDLVEGMFLSLYSNYNLDESYKVKSTMLFSSMKTFVENLLNPDQALKDKLYELFN